MDEKNILKLRELFGYYDIHEDCVEEILRFVVKKGIIKKFNRLFQKRTEFIKTMGMEAIQTDGFEKLQAAPGLYSMKFKSADMNLRIIFSYYKDKIVMLLCCFYERDDSKDTYSKYISVAQKRRKEMEERYGKNY